ncbi:hypothetical protein ABTL80_19965, partial [Acinetobacter baumannii]
MGVVTWGVRSDAARRRNPAKSSVHRSLVPIAVLLALSGAAAHAGQPATPTAMKAYADRLLNESKIKPDGP